MKRSRPFSSGTPGHSWFCLLARRHYFSDGYVESNETLPTISNDTKPELLSKALHKKQDSISMKPSHQSYELILSVPCLQYLLAKASISSRPTSRTHSCTATAIFRYTSSSQKALPMSIIPALFFLLIKRSMVSNKRPDSGIS